MLAWDMVQISHRISVGMRVLVHLPLLLVDEGDEPLDGVDDLLIAEDASFILVNAFGEEEEKGGNLGSLTAEVCLGACFGVVCAVMVDSFFMACVERSSSESWDSEDSKEEEE